MLGGDTARQLTLRRALSERLQIFPKDELDKVRVGLLAY